MLAVPSWLVCLPVWGRLWAVFIACVIGLIHASILVQGYREWRLIGAVTILGVVADSIFFRFQLLSLSPQPLIIPLWLACLWFIFSTTLNHCFSFLQGRWLLSALVGAIAGPLSYWVGGEIADVTLLMPTTLIVLSLFWAVFLPLSLWVAHQWCGDV